MVSKKPTEELGLGENQNFLDRENHIFLNKLNYICKNYDTAFKDVSHTLRVIPPLGETPETSDGRPSPGPDGEVTTNYQ